MFQRLDLFVLSCLSLLESQTGLVLPPQNLSVVWKSDFEPWMYWEPPQHSVEQCTYTVKSVIGNEHSETTYKRQNSPWDNGNEHIVMDGGFLQLSVETACPDGHSEPAVFNITYPDLVKELECCIISSKRSHCSWVVASHAPALGFFYRLRNENTETHPALRKCPSYTAGVRPGCDLQAAVSDDIHIVFNGTLNNALVRNTFKKHFDDCVIPHLNWTVTKREGQFLISWSPPDILNLSQWKFIINYTECDIEKFKDERGRTSTHLDLVPHCPYRMAIKAELDGATMKMAWSDEKYFDAETNPKAFLILISTITTLMFAGLAALTFVYCRKNKENIFPKVPQPRDLVSNISDNNNKSTVRNLYIPAEEEDNCKIVLVIDPLIN